MSLLDSLDLTPSLPPSPLTHHPHAASPARFPPSDDGDSQTLTLPSTCPSPVPPSITESVTVVVRIRPPLQPPNPTAPHLLPHPNTSQISAPTTTYQFSTVYPSTTMQSELYTTSIKPLVTSFMAGFNSTVFAYGQTGSGKSYTMGTEYNAGAAPHPSSLGVIPRVLHSIFAAINAPSDWTYTVSVTFLEIYNETVKDLLDTRERVISIHTDGNNDIKIGNVKPVEAGDVVEALRLVTRGSGNRTVGRTRMNEGSSRSHGVVTVWLKKERTTVDTITGERMVERVLSKFHLVDLAGSERVERTGSSGVRLKESANINGGLLTLGKVIRALAREETEKRRNSDNPLFRSGHVPYRESKLTRFLQDSLGGRSRTVMIACVSPDSIDFNEAVCTLSYASVARGIRNRPVVVERVLESLELPRPPVAAPAAAVKGGNLAKGGNLTKDVVDMQYIIAEAKYLMENFGKQHGKSLSSSGVAALQQITNLLVGENEKMNPEIVESVIKVKDEEIEEYRKDLERDEEIFAVKSKEIRTLQKVVSKQKEQIKELEKVERLNTPERGPGQDASTRLQLESSAFHRRQRQFDREIQEVEINAQVKRDLIETIQRSRGDANNLMARHEVRKEELGRRIGCLKREIEQRERERMELTCGSIEEDSFAVDITDEVERSLALAESELGSLSHQILDQGRIVALQKQSVVRIEELRAEIVGMEERKEELMRGMEELEREYGEARKRILGGWGEGQPQGGEISPMKDEAAGDDKENLLREVDLRREVEKEKKRSSELLGMNMKLLQDLKHLSQVERGAGADSDRGSSAGSGKQRRVVVSRRKLVEVPPPPPPTSAV